MQLRILLLENDVDLSAILTDALTEAGHDVVVCHTLSEGIDSVSEDVFDLLLLDVYLDIGTSLGVANYCGFASPATQIIFMSGNRHSDLATLHEKCRDAAYFFRKPVQLSELLDLIEQISLVQPQARTRLPGYVAPINARQKRAL